VQCYFSPFPVLINPRASGLRAERSRCLKCALHRRCRSSQQLFLILPKHLTRISCLNLSDLAPCSGQNFTKLAGAANHGPFLLPPKLCISGEPKQGFPYRLISSLAAQVRSMQTVSRLRAEPLPGFVVRPLDRSLHFRKVDPVTGSEHSKFRIYCGMEISRYKANIRIRPSDKSFEAGLVASTQVHRSIAFHPSMNVAQSKPNSSAARSASPICQEAKARLPTAPECEPSCVWSALKLSTNLAKNQFVSTPIVNGASRLARHNKSHP
jgi:hypothetical protein